MYPLDKSNHVFKSPFFLASNNTTYGKMWKHTSRRTGCREMEKNIDPKHMNFHFANFQHTAYRKFSPLFKFLAYATAMTVGIIGGLF